MTRNTGKSSEQIFEETLGRLGKRCYYYRIVDAAEVRGRTGKIGFTRPAPSDYIVTLDGFTFYAEVKSTQDQSAFRFSLLRTKQSAAARQILAAGGSYFVMIHRLTTGTWYRVSYDLIDQVKAEGKASIPWANLEAFAWNITTT